jgi:hypothetical protein
MLQCLTGQAARIVEPELPLWLVAVDPALIGGDVEPRIEQFKPILDDAIPGRRAVLEKGPVAVAPAVAP